MLTAGSSALVTGGAGFIGATLVGLLRSLDVPTTVVDRLPPARADRLTPFQEDDGVTYHAIALDDPGLERIVAGHTTVFHLAANTENRGDRAGAYADVEQTVLGTAALLRALAAAEDATTIVLASSQLVYATDTGGEITEISGKVSPPTRFAAGKVAAEAFLHAHCSEHGHRGAACRLANIVGPDMRRGIVHDLTTALRADPRSLEVLGDGSQTRSYLHVEDCAAALVVAAEQTKGYATYNVCNEDTISAATVAEIVSDEAAGERPAISFTGGKTGWRGDVPTLRARPEALLGAGWRPTMDSRQAVRSTVRKMLNEPPEPKPVAVEQPQQPTAQRWQVIGRRQLYDSRWVGLSLVSVKPPGQDRYDHHVVALPPAVGVVLNCPRKGILLLYRHRFITDSIGYEVPAGGIEDGESVESAAARETLEETGWQLADAEPLISCNVSDGVSDQRFHLVQATTGDYAGPPVDSYEASSQIWVGRRRVPDLIRDGRVPGALSLVALLYAMSVGRI